MRQKLAHCDLNIINLEENDDALNFSSTVLEISDCDISEVGKDRVETTEGNHIDHVLKSKDIKFVLCNSLVYILL